jgi:hypothetical protein
VETGEFVEAGIGCESCHGPGGWHAGTLGLGRIHVSLDAQVCGQCHTRGTDPTGVFHFPVGYRPGDDLAAHFELAAPTPGQNSGNWWGNGRPRRRHQEYYAWSRGGHAESLESLREGYDGRFGPVESECLRCHAAEAALAPERSFALDDVVHGITCAVCHHVHGELDEPRLECASCHPEGAFYHEPSRNATHVPCPPEARVGCVSCHMPLVVENGGAFTLHSHAPGVIPPGDATRYDMPTSCANGGCHTDRRTEWLQTEFERQYGKLGADAAALATSD